MEAELDQENDPRLRIISLFPLIGVAAAIVETMFRPAPGGSYALLAYVGISPLLLAWVLARLR